MAETIISEKGRVMTDTVNVERAWVDRFIAWVEAFKGTAPEGTVDEMFSLYTYARRFVLAAAQKAEPVTGSLAEMVTELVNETAPDQGQTPSRAFALALSLQASLASQPEAPKVEQEPVMVPEVFWSWLVERGLVPDDPDFEWNDIVEILNEHENELIHPAPASDELLEALEAVMNELDFENKESSFFSSNHYDTVRAFIAKHKGPQS